MIFSVVNIPDDAISTDEEDNAEFTTAVAVVVTSSSSGRESTNNASSFVVVDADPPITTLDDTDGSVRRPVVAAGAKAFDNGRNAAKASENIECNFILYSFTERDANTAIQ